ncbi:MAG TPA: TetR/AcrR family transcriptional regulator [Labilithrix sp.]|nr:TetR/AcrR family transcriptional regulator [Labilithrix sp.]
MRASRKSGAAKSAAAARRRLESATPSPPRRGRDDDEARARVRLDVDERRAQLIELGLAEFGSRTYDDVSIEVIAHAAGISKGLLYHYFPTKRAFYVSCVREAASRLLAQMDLPPEIPPLAGVQLRLDRYLEFVRKHGNAFATLMRSRAGADRELAAVVDETRTRLLERLTSGLADLFPAAPATTASSPLLRIALHGWVGLAEAASIAWVEACVEPPRDTTNAQPAPTAEEVRDLLASALLTIVQSAVGP